MITLDGQTLTLADLVAVARDRAPVRLAPEARGRMERSYAWVQDAGRLERPIYGVNTGFGSLARVRIAAEHRETLSRNLVLSHAAGVGPPLPRDVVRATMLLRANALAKGVSGCQPAIVDVLLQLLNADLVPVVPSQGSCGSSGDLAPLSHIGLVLAEGDQGLVWEGDRVVAAAEALERHAIPRLRLGAKDGLAITNGAQATAALLALGCHDAAVLVLAAEVVAAMSIDALRGVTRAFAAAVHDHRPYRGARASAANLRLLLAGSTLVDSVPGKVQDAYSLRCTPVVVGAVRDALAHVTAQVGVELNSATDNPLVLVDDDDDDKAFSAGLFHGEPLGLAADYLRTAVSEIGALSERRLYRLTTGSLSGRLPPALARRDRPELGMLLPQTTAAALVSETRALGFPSSIDSIPTCEDQEDHVAMSTTAARRLAEVLWNVRTIVAIEAMGALAALRVRREEGASVRFGEGTRAAYERLWVDVDAMLPSEAIAAISERIGAGVLTDVVPGLIAVGDTP